MDFQYPQGIFLEKNNGPFKSVEFAQKCRCFSNQNVPQGDYMKMKFDNFQIQKLISQTDRAEKQMKKLSKLSSLHAFLLVVFKSPEVVNFRGNNLETSTKLFNLKLKYIQNSKLQHNKQQHFLKECNDSSQIHI